MKICIITNLYPPYVIGGAERYLEGISKELVKNNEVVVITTKPFSGFKSLIPEMSIEDNIRVYRFFPLNLYSPYHAKDRSGLLKPFWHIIDLWNPHSYVSVSKILKKERPDIIHTNNLPGLSTSIFTLLNRRKESYVHTLHDYGLLSPYSALYRNNKIVDKWSFWEKYVYQPIKRRASKKVPMVISPSKFVIDKHVANQYFKDSERRVLPFDVLVRRKGSITSSKKKVINFLYSGQVSKHKGVYVLLEATKKIKSNDFILRVVGKGDEYERLKGSVQEKDNIKFYGFLEKKELNKVYKKSDVLIVPSVWYDNSPLVIYDAMGWSLPVIASNIGGIPELVEDGVNGYLFQAGWTSDLTEKMSLFLERPSLIDELSKGCITYRKKFKKGDHIKNLISVYVQKIRR